MKLTHTQGDTFQQDLLFKVDGEALDLTDVTVFFTVRERPGSKIILQKQGVMEEASEGKCVISATAQEMDIPVGSYYYDYEVQWNNGNKETPLKGKIQITYQITT